MKCLYCGKKITLLRKLKDSEFCKDEHRQQYLREQEQMAIARLKGAQLWAKGEKADREEEQKAKAEASQIPADIKAGMKSFLPLLPHVISRKGFLRLRPDSIPQHPEVWLPEFLASVDNSNLHTPAGEIAFTAEPAPAQVPASTQKPADQDLDTGLLLPEPEHASPPEAGPVYAAATLRSSGAAFVPHQEHELAWPISIGLINIKGLPLPAAVLAAAGRLDVHLEPGLLAPGTAPVLAGETLPAPPSSTPVLPLAVLRPLADPVAQAEEPLAEALPLLPGEAQAAAVPMAILIATPETMARIPVLPPAALRPVADAAPQAEAEPDAAIELLPHAAPAPAAPATLAPAAAVAPEALPFPALPAFSQALTAHREAGIEFLPIHTLEPEFVEVPEAPPADPPASIHIYPLSAPQTQPTAGRMRKPRAREIFFSTPRLHDLPALAAAVARSNQEAVRMAPGTNGWDAGLLSLLAPRQSAWTESRPHTIVPFEACDQTGATALPLLSLPASNVQLPWAAETTFATAAAIELPAAPLLAGALQAPETWNSDVQEPALAATPAGLTLAAAWLQAPAPFTIHAGAQPRIACATPSPLEGDQTGQPQPPTWTHPRPAAGVRATGGLAPLQPSGNGGRHNLHTSEPEFEPLAGASSPAAAYPATRPMPDVAPPMISEMWPLLPGDALPYPAGTLAIHTLEATWPEGNAQLPRLQADILEDRALRERLFGRAGLRASTGSRMSRVAGGFSFPTFAIPARPDAKWLVMLVPVALLLAVYSLTGDSKKERPVATAQDLAPAAVEAAIDAPAAPVNPVNSARRRRKAEPVEAPAAAEPVAILPAAVDPNAGFAEGVKASIMRRSAISFTDDFRTGLADWQGGDNWSTQWSYDAAGFVNTGPLALYTPSMSLSNYRMEFLGQIDRKSLGWVFRAKDLKNYYAAKITLVRGGPLPSAVIEHYAVLNGKESQHQRRPLPIQIRTDTLYRVKLDVNDEDFTLTVQGQLVDHWSDSSLKHGGIGFFSAKGELARLRWVEVSHQYDFLGRLCALLVPYQIPARDGSLK
ncbi:MAG: hypothetical protein JNK87_12040 [Bryobacterales bacterium]|nr:hypothetical protein [Bryobacterales bacterium]